MRTDEIGQLNYGLCVFVLCYQGWKMPPRVTLDESIELVASNVASLQSNQQYAIEVARDKLLFVEYNIERRYLRPPFGPGYQLVCCVVVFKRNAKGVFA